MEKNVYEIIDEFLETLKKNNGRYPPPSVFFDSIYKKEALYLIKEYKLIDIPNGVQFEIANCSITTLGEWVINNSNSKKYIESKQVHNNLQVSRTESKLKYESKTAKWIYYTYWVTFTISIIAFALSVYNFINDRAKDQQSQKTIARPITPAKQ